MPPIMVVSGSPNINYHLNIQIKNRKEISYTLTLDKFPRYEGYISINGGKFNTLYQYKEIGGFENLYENRGTFKGTISYEAN